MTPAERRLLDTVASTLQTLLATMPSAFRDAWEALVKARENMRREDALLHEDHR